MASPSPLVPPVTSTFTGIPPYLGRMTAWKDVERAEPEFAQRVRGLVDGHRHKTIATLRADGSPRISGIEAAFEDGELVFGSMPDARKGADLRRDPRFALHSATVDPVRAPKRNGRAGEISGRRSTQTGHRGIPRRSLLRRHRRGRAHPSQREGHDARRRVVDPHARVAQRRARVILDRELSRPRITCRPLVPAWSCAPRRAAGRPWRSVRRVGEGCVSWHRSTSGRPCGRTG